MKTGDKIKATTESARTTKKKQKGDHRIKIENITKHLKKLCTKTTKKSRMEIWRVVSVSRLRERDILCFFFSLVHYDTYVFCGEYDSSCLCRECEYFFFMFYFCGQHNISRLKGQMQ